MRPLEAPASATCGPSLLPTRRDADLQQVRMAHEIVHMNIKRLARARAARLARVHDRRPSENPPDMYAIASLSRGARAPYAQGANARKHRSKHRGEIFALLSSFVLSCGPGTRAALRDAGAEELPECQAYAAAFTKCVTNAVGPARAAATPHPIFQTVFSDDASREQARERCRRAGAQIESTCR